uniref:Putative glycosyl transferase n=1 Tax=mine drainage metagenome TaxID=410659 RepID=E6PZR5_9ZZZZ
MEWLVAQGHDVRVVTAPPYYPAWQVRHDYRSGRYLREHLHGAIVYRCPLWVPAQPRGLKRMLHLFSFALSSLPVMLMQTAWKPQVVFTIEPAFFCAPVALFAARLARAPAWLHVQDFEIDAAFELGILPSGGNIHRFALAFERVFMRQFQRVSSISSSMVRRSLTKGVLPDHAVLFPNWVDIDAIYPLTGENSFRKELGLSEDKVVLLYSGNMGEKQGLDTLGMLAQRFASETRAHFIFCGDGAFRPQLEQMVQGMSNVSLLPLQPFERLNELLNAADIHLLPQKADAADLVMPSKLTGMLSSGKPVLATADEGTQVAKVVQGRGFAVPTGDMDAACEAIHVLVNDTNLRHAMGVEARAYAVDHLGREQVLRRFEDDLKRLVEVPEF